ncbi:MAG: DUF5723 family protein [Crocinitomicaceae bacterium]|nr:hypothetical protein [Crocinitomicaceae bacterium]
MRSYLIIIAFFSFGLSNAQLYHGFAIDSNFQDKKLVIDFQTEDYYGTLNIQNIMIDRFAFGGYIDQHTKDLTSHKLTQNNRLGGETYSQITFYDYKTNLFKKERLGYYLGIGYRNYVNGNITQDVFNLAMYGNAPYLNQELNLNNTRLQNLAYWKLNFGFFDKKYGSGGNISFLYGNRFIKGELENGSFYANDEIVNLKGNGQVSFSDGSKNGLGAFNGWGVSVDFNWNIPINWFKTKAIIQLKAENIGFISWNKGTTTYAVDSTYSFYGFDFSDIINGNSALNNETDWMDSLNVKETKGNVMTWIPARITFAKVIDQFSERKLQSTFGVRMITTRDYFPQIFAGVYYRPVNWFAVGATLRYGGFDSFDGGLRLDFMAKDFFAISISTASVYGTFSNKGYGRSINVGIRGTIK